MKKLSKLSDDDIVNAVIEAEVELAIGLGYSDKMIRERVAPISKADIYKISVRIGLRRRDYRNGVSPLSKFIWSKATTAMRKQRTLPPTSTKLLKRGWVDS